MNVAMVDVLSDPADFGASEVRALPFKRHTEVIREHLRLQDSRILDVGCGDGGLVRWFARRGARVEGLEPAEHQLALARAAELQNDETYTQGVAEKLPFANDSFDACVFFNSLHHVPVDQQSMALTEAARVICPEGRLYVAEPVADGTLFQTMQPVDDETEIRAAAERALQAFSPELGKLILRDHYHTRRHYKTYDSFVDDLCQVSPERRSLFEEKQELVSNLWHTLGEPTDEGMRFYQPMRVTIIAIN